MSNDANQSLLGRTLGDRYVVDRLLGTGAMGTVYCARQMGLGTLVAIKVLHPQLATDRSWCSGSSGRRFRHRDSIIPTCFAYWISAKTAIFATSLRSTSRPRIC